MLAFVRDTRGGTAMEAAILMPVLALAVIGALQFGVYIMGLHQARGHTDASARAVRMLDSPTQAEVLETLLEHTGAPPVGRYEASAQTVEAGGERQAVLTLTYRYTIRLPLLAEMPLARQTSARVRLRALDY